MAGETSLNNQAAVRDGSYHPTHGTIHRKFTFRDVGAGEIVLGVLPAGAAVTGGQVWVTTIFNGTTPVINVGVAGTPALFASALALTAVVGLAFAANLLAAAVPTGSPRNIVATLTVTGASTAGACDVYLEFTP